MSKQKEARNRYRKVAELVSNLIIATEHDDMQWEDMGPLSFFRAEYRGIRYGLDWPQDGRPELVVDDAVVWVGYQLRALHEVIVHQDNRLHPRAPLPFPLPPEDPIAPLKLDWALKTFKKTD